MKHRVVIVGGGFGGIKTALELADDKRFKITLISDRTDFRYYPLLYRTATGGKRNISSIPLAEIFKDKDVELKQAEVTKLDRPSHTVITKDGETIRFNSLVLALGVQTNYFGISGLKELAYDIKSIEGAEGLKRHLHEQLIDQQKPDYHYVVVGGGPTGIELAAALPSYIKRIMKKHGLRGRTVHVDLVEAAPRLLPRMPKDISWQVKRRLKKLGVRLYLNTSVQAQTADELMVNGKPIRSHTVVWTAGVMNHPFFAANDFQLIRPGKVRVNQYLQHEPGIFVIGDNADTPYSGMAQTAVEDGIYVARYLKTVAADKEPKTYIPKKPVYVFPGGPGWAAVLWGKVRLYGRVGWVLRSLADLVAYSDYEVWHKAALRWAQTEADEDHCPICEIY